MQINPAEADVSGLVTYRLKLGAAEASERIWPHFVRRRPPNGLEEQQAPNKRYG